LWWRIVTRGKAAPSATVQLGVNTIFKMAQVIQAIESKLIPRYQEKRHPLVGAPRVNVAVIEGGTQVNTFSDECTIEIDRCIVPGEVTSKGREEFRALLEELKASDPEFDAVMEEAFLEDIPHRSGLSGRPNLLAHDAFILIGDSPTSLTLRFDFREGLS